MNAIYQNFSAPQGGAETAARIAALRQKLAGDQLTGFIIPREDEYQGEQVPAAHERLLWLTGFNGSAGMAIILPHIAALFVDGRYTLQAAQQTDTQIIDVIHSFEQNPRHWLKAHIAAGDRIGIDPRLHTIASYRQFERVCIQAGASIQPIAINPIDTLWTDRPPLPNLPVHDHPLSLSGESASKKIARLSATLESVQQDALLITQPENIAWLLNIRGSDVPHTPFALSTAILHADQHVDWFIDGQRVSDDIRTNLGERLRVQAPADLGSTLNSLTGQHIWLDPASTPMWFIQQLKGAQIYEAGDPIALPKACKNEVEIEGAAQAHIWDGVALCRFLHWLDTDPRPKTEISAACQLEAYRRENNQLKDLSFDTISGSGPNGAIVHYRVTEATDRALQLGTLYLVDSGGQYPCGTTDVTRTVLIGDTPTAEMVDHFTRVLRGHIALAKVHFPEGTTGGQLDALARAPLWDVGLDFDHGTGHGVGSYLSVHEGPHRISKASDVALQPGMIVSNEPGYYQANAYGIRIENLQYVGAGETRQGRQMLCFHTLTLAPIDRRLIDTAMLAASERQWLNDYHATVYRQIAPLLDPETASWLQQACAPLDA